MILFEGVTSNVYSTANDGPPGLPFSGVKYFTTVDDERSTFYQRIYEYDVGITGVSSPLPVAGPWTWVLINNEYIALDEESEAPWPALSEESGLFPPSSV